MPAFTPIDKALKSSAPASVALIRKLSPRYLFVYLMLFSLCYKGKHYKRMREISYIYLSNELCRMYGANFATKRQVRRACDKIVSLGLIERSTASFLKPYGTQLLPTKTSYYRISTP